jgi:hypothetical protein
MGATDDENDAYFLVQGGSDTFTFVANYIGKFLFTILSIMTSLF